MATPAQLQEARQRITEHMAGPGAADLPVYLCYVDPHAEVVVVGVPPSSRTASELRRALNIDEAVPLRFVESSPAERDAGK